MFTVVLTGGIGSGKSEAARLFVKLGAQYFDSDAVVRELLAGNEMVRQRLIERWGQELVEGSKEQMRCKLKDRLLNSKTDRCWLENLLHPLVVEQLNRARCAEDVATCLSWRSGCATRKNYLLAEIPLYFQMDSPPPVDRVLLIECSEATRVERLRRGRCARLNERQIAQFIALQAVDDIDRTRVDDVINNDGSLIQLAEQVACLHERYMRLGGA